MIRTSMATVGRVWRSGRGDLKLYLLSVFSLAVAFVCLASALLVVVNLRAVEVRWKRAGRMSIYLKDGVTDDQLQVLRHAVEQTPGVVSTKYISQLEARKDMIDDGISGSLASLPVEAFPASVEVALDSEVADVEVAALADKLRNVPSIESVETYQKWTDRVSALVRGGVAASTAAAKRTALARMITPSRAGARRQTPTPRRAPRPWRPWPSRFPKAGT